MAARQKIPQFVRSRRPARAQYSNSLKGGTVRSLPIIEQVVQLGIQVLGGRIPRLHEKVVEVGLVDSADRGVRVGIGGEQCPLGVRVYLPRFLKKPNTIHARHALIREEKSHSIIANLQSLEQVQRSFWGVAADHTVGSAVLRSQIAL